MSDLNKISDTIVANLNISLDLKQEILENQDFKSGKVPVKSAGAAKHGDKRHFGHYGPHFEYWKSRWGWERDNVRNTFPQEKYKGSLISDFYNLDHTKGPLKVFK